MVFMIIMLTGFAYLNDTANRGLTEDFGPDSKLSMPESCDRGY